MISDFGLARTVDDATLTRTGVVAGTPHYMSPEQATGQPVDHRSDLFSLGSSIYFMCTGRPPFRAEHALAILNRICNDEHRPVDEVNSDVPAELADVVDRLLSKNPADRFRDATEVERTLEAILVRLQNGQRPGRRRWRRTWLRWRPAALKTAIGAGIVFACVMAGVALSRFGMTSVETPIVEVSPTDSITKSGSIPSALMTLPPDTFERDLAEARSLLETIEADSKVMLEPSDNHDKWRSELDQLTELLK